MRLRLQRTESTFTFSDEKGSIISARFSFGIMQRKQVTIAKDGKPFDYIPSFMGPANSRTAQYIIEQTVSDKIVM